MTTEVALTAEGLPRQDDPSRERLAVAEMGRLSGELIRRRRTALGMTQAQLAQRVGVTQGAIQKWETGTRLARDYWRLRLAQELGRDVIELFPFANRGAA